MKGDSRFRVVDGGMADTDNIKETIELGRNPKINSSIEGNGSSWERKGGKQTYREIIMEIEQKRSRKQEGTGHTT